MYRRRDPDRLRLSLVHGSDQQEYFPDLFERQVFLSKVTPDRWISISSTLSNLDQYRRRLIFVRQAMKWLDVHAKEFEVFHGMTNYSFTLLPALRAATLDLPVCTRVANLRGELVDQDGWRNRLKLSDRRLALISRLDAVIAISRDIERKLVEGGVPEEKVVYIPNCVDTSRFGPAGSASEKSALKAKFGLEDNPIIAFIGELTERKRPHLLLQALCELSDLHFGWQLVLAGPANDRAYARRLESYADEQGWKNRIRFLGYVPNIEEVYKAADIFCLPSQDEGMPGALLEAMVSRLACIVTDFSGVRELIEDGTSGRVVSPSPSAIAAALRDYLCEEPLRTAHGDAARQVGLTRHTTDKILQEHMELFDRLRAGRTPRQD
jgi:glycosyltransferase involved in cell wall biosynthesis